MIANVSSLLIALALQTPQAPEDLPVLRPGDVLEGTIEQTDPVIRTAFIDGYPGSKAHGKSFRVERSEPGPFFIELRSHLFDAYLVLRGSDGQPLLEDGNGLLNTHSRIVVAANVEGPFLLDAVDFYGWAGAFHLSVHSGEPAPLSSTERRERAIADARESLEVREQALGPDHPKTALSLSKLAMLLQDEGAYDHARSLYERALRIRETSLGPDHPKTAMSLNKLAMLLHAQGAYDEARPLFERELRIREAAFVPDNPRTVLSLRNLASNLNNLASLLEAQGAYDEARPLFERALRIREAALGPDHPDTAMSLNNLAGLLRAQGAVDEARPLLERALQIWDAALGPDHPKTALSLNNLASLLWDQRAYDEARPLFERALRIFEAAFGPDHPDTATSLSNLGALLRDQGAVDEAQPLFERALRIWETALGPDHPRTALSLSNLAGLLRDQGAYDPARPLLERALRIRKTALGPDHPITASSLNDLAILLLAQGAYDDARPLFEQALRINEAALGPDHPSTAVSLNNLANLEFDLGETEQALARSEAALLGSTAHLGRVLWSLSEAERLRFVRAREWQLEQLLSFTRGMAAEASRRAGYESVLGWKGQVARSLLRDGRREIRSLPEAERAIVERLRALQTRLSDTVYEKHVADPAAHADRLKKLRGQRNEQEVELARLRGRGEGEGDRGKRSGESTRLAALTAALPEAAAAVDFFVHGWYEPAAWEGDELVREGAWTEPHLSCWVLRSGEPLTQLDLGPAAAVEEAVREFLERLVQRRGTAVPTGDDSSLTSDESDRLRTLLWEPLAVAVGDARTVFVSGDSFLGALPFETIQREDGSYLIEHHAFSYLADMQSLGEALATVEKRVPTLFAAGGIDYRRRGELDADDEAEGLIAMADTRASLSRRWHPLDGTAAEVSAIADLHLEATNDEGTQQVLTERAATEERIKESLERFTHVHVATHGYFHPEGLPSAWKKIREQDQDGRDLLRETEQQVVGLLPGLLSGLVFAGANAKPDPGRDNGLLTAEEITYLDLSDCDLVVLSACETGLGRPEGGEGMIGLRRAFRMAGARTVISSLWEVSDTATRELMTLFYENLWLEEESKQEALRNAQLMQLEYNRERHGHGLPSTWGAFVLDGAPD